MRFHVVALPQSNTTRAYSMCGFSQKTIRFCWMMKSLGHDVFLYGGPENQAVCNEHIVCINEEDQKAIRGDRNYIYPIYNPKHVLWVAYNNYVAKEINARKQPGDIICILGGNCQSSLMELVPDLKVVEYGIGYTGYACKWLVFESHVWRAFCMGRNDQKGPNHDTHVIHSFYDENEFDATLPREDFALFVGRVSESKGVKLACEAAAMAGIKLKVAGFGDEKLVGHGAEHLGPITLKERNRLMGTARVLMCPTLSIEPFGNVACEAQMCGTPVISTNVGGFVETVLEGATGFRISDVKQAATALLNVCKLAPAEAIRQRAVSMWSVRRLRYEYQRYFARISTL